MRHIITIAMVIGALWMAQPAAIAAQDNTYTVSAQIGLNLRSGPGLEYDVLDLMPYGSQVQLVDDSSTNWQKVAYGDTVGWAHNSWLTTEALPPLAEQSTSEDNQSSGGGSIDSVICQAAATYGQSCAAMQAVAWCESTYVVGAVGPYGEIGLFQFLPSTWASTPFADQDIYDPVAQANAAAWMWSEGRRGEWYC